jgi:transposase
MPQRFRAEYPPEFRRQMVELVRSGKSHRGAAQEFEPIAQSIRNWVAQADRDEGRRSDGLTTAEREVRQLREEREIQQKAVVRAVVWVTPIRPFRA